MPIEVRELVIQAFVDSSTSSGEDDEAGSADMEAVKQIQASVDQVMAMIKNKNER